MKARRRGPAQVRTTVLGCAADPCRVALTVRLATPDDAEAVATILRAAFAPFRDAYTVQAYAATTPPADVIGNRLAEGPIWLALAGLTCVGTASAVSRGLALSVRSMAVLPAAQGRGVGRALLAAAEEHARHTGHTSLVLSTTPFLRQAIRLYAHAGFQTDVAAPRDLHGTPLVGMRKAL